MLLIQRLITSLELPQKVGEQHIVESMSFRLRMSYGRA
jgi:hypothetical protein